MKLYTADGQYAVTVKVTDEVVLIEGPFKAEIKEVVGRERTILVDSVETKVGIVEIEEVLPANSVENVKEFLAYPGRWGFTRED